MAKRRVSATTKAQRTLKALAGDDSPKALEKKRRARLTLLRTETAWNRHRPERLEPILAELREIILAGASDQTQTRALRLALKLGMTDREGFALIAGTTEAEAAEWLNKLHQS